LSGIEERRLLVSSGMKAKVLLVVGIGVLASTVSCTPETQAPRRRPAVGAPKQQAAAQPVQLTREGVIQIAWREARQSGYDPNNSDATYDSGNAAWMHMEARMTEVARNVGSSAPPSMFAGHDYQVVYFHHRDAVVGGLLYVFIDINTGRVLGSIAGQ
jgi:hypothetical protein